MIAEFIADLTDRFRAHAAFSDLECMLRNVLTQFESIEVHG